MITMMENDYNNGNDDHNHDDHNHDDDGDEDDGDDLGGLLLLSTKGASQPVDDQRRKSVQPFTFQHDDNDDEGSDDDGVDDDD